MSKIYIKSWIISGRRPSIDADMIHKFNYIIFGLINQPQVWIKHRSEQVATIINYLLIGVINQPQFRIERKGENMEGEPVSTEQKGRQVEVKVHGGSSGAVYGLGMIGACVYFIGRGNTAREKSLGFLKAIVWPAYLVYDALQYLHQK